MTDFYSQVSRQSARCTHGSGVYTPLKSEIDIPIPTDADTQICRSADNKQRTRNLLLPN